MTVPIIWQQYPNQPTLSEKIGKHFNLSPIIGQLMLNRSIQTLNEAQHFIHNTWTEFPQLPNQEHLMHELKQLIAKQAAICIYGDYDVDGVTSTTMLVDILRTSGCTVDFIVPHRFNDGYGLNMNRMNEIARKKYDALITIDCGISNKNEIDALNQQHPTIKTLIIDHHKCPEELPNATAIVNPQLAGENHPARHLCSAALVDYLFRTSPELCISTESYSDLAAIGLIADVMPLTKLNRWYVKKGLLAIQTSPRAAILELCIQANINHRTICSRDIGFGIGPRLNAPGRLGDPRPAVELLLTSDTNTIKKHAQTIDQLNTKRRTIGEKIHADINHQLSETPELTNGSSIVCSGQFWHMGIIGINASKLVNTYHKPAVVIGFDSDIARGSARSIPGVNIYNILKKCANTLQHFGGHSQAAGFSLNPKNILAFKDAFYHHSQHIPKTLQNKTLLLDTNLHLNSISLDLIDELQQLEPHGEGNPKPLFYATVNLIDGKKVGKTKTHLKCRLEQDNAIIDGIGFNLGHALNTLSSPTVQIAFHISKNNFREKVSPQIEIIDIKPYGN